MGGLPLKTYLVVVEPDYMYVTDKLLWKLSNPGAGAWRQGNADVYPLPGAYFGLSIDHLERRGGSDTERPN